VAVGPAWLKNSSSLRRRGRRDVIGGAVSGFIYFSGFTFVPARLLCAARATGAGTPIPHGSLEPPFGNQGTRRVAVKGRYNVIISSGLFLPPACNHGQGPCGFDCQRESFAPSARTATPAADRMGTSPSCVCGQSGRLAPVAANSADPYHRPAGTFLERRFCPLRASLDFISGVHAAAFADNDSLCVGPIQSMGLGKTVSAAGCDPQVDHLLPA